MDNWLTKFASKQPTQLDNFRQQVEALPFNELRELMGPTSTENIDSFQTKAASAIRQGRQMAHEIGPRLIEKSAQEVEETKAIADVVSALSDEDAVKVAHILEHGSDVEKVAVVGRLMTMAGKGLKAVGGFAAKRPGMAAAIGGAGLGAMMGGEGNRLGGAMAGGLMGAGAAKMIPGAKGAIQKGAFGMGLHGQNMINKGMPKMAEEVEGLYKTAFAMSAKCGGFGDDTSWLAQFEGTPLLEQAIALAEQELQIEIQGIQMAQQRQQERREDDSWTQRDIIGARKKLLELQLVSQRNGLGEQPQGEQAPQEQAPQQPQPQQQAQQPQQGQQQQGVGGPGGVQMPMGQQKQAGALGQAAGLAMKHPAAAMGTVGAIGGAAQGLGDPVAPGQSRLGQIGRRAAIGGAMGAATGAIGAHVMKAKVASLPFPSRR